jgi:hypothetical protein
MTTELLGDGTVYENVQHPVDGHEPKHRDSRHRLSLLLAVRGKEPNFHIIQ